MTVKEHYENHLGHFYAWMAGDFQLKTQEFKKFLSDHSFELMSTKTAIDLGCGHGIQSVPLAEIGFHVVAVDFNHELLEELRKNARDLPIEIINDDIKNIKKIAKQAELIVCCGDTLSHLDSKTEVKTFIEDIVNSLIDNGRLIFSFRDASTELTGTDRFIPVKSDSDRILTCVLEYENEFIKVTDLLYERSHDGWKQKVSSYKKVRLLTHEIVEHLEENGMTINFNDITNRLTTIVATKENQKFNASLYTGET